MASPATQPPDTSGPRSLPTAAELSDAFKVEVYDREGKTHALGDLVKEKRSVLIFIRHFCKYLYAPYGRGRVEIACQLL